MVSLKEHIELFKKLFRFRGRNNFVRMVWHVANEHAEEITCEDFIKAITKEVEVVEPIKKGK